jgi:hypothetical protein
MDGGEIWRSPVNSAIKSATYIGCHTFVTLVLISSTRLIAIALEELGDPKVFDSVPVRYLFDLMDVVFIVIFIFGSALSAVRAFKEKNDD